MKSENINSNKSYAQFNDYHFKSILEKRANGLLKFVKIPYKIKRRLLSELTTIGPKISRIDFVAVVEDEGKEISLIVECQSELPSDEDIKRFFQYVSSLRVFKDSNVVLYILCTKKAPYSKREFVINDDCIYTMHVISLKDFKAEEIFKSIEDKLNNNEKITDEDIASLQLIIYTDFRESQLEVLNRARALIDEISDCGNFDINEKSAIIYLFEVLSVNMLDKDDHDKYMEVNKMLINPRERYIREEAIKEGEKNGKDKGKLEVARTLLNRGYPIDEVVEVSGLPKKDILNAK